jgi:hypothetical protein
VTLQRPLVRHAARPVFIVVAVYTLAIMLYFLHIRTHVQITSKHFIIYLYVIYIKNIDCRNRHPNSDSNGVPSDLCAPANFEKLQYIRLVCACVFIFCINLSLNKNLIYKLFFVWVISFFNRYNIMCLRNAQITSILHTINVKIIILLL